MKFNREGSKKGITVGIVYATLVCTLGVYFNYTQPYDATPLGAPSMILLFLWFLLYVPLGLFATIAGWQIKDLGFSVTRRVVIALFPVLLLCASLAWSIRVPWQSALVEAFARTGEEVFFRGFLFLLLLKTFEGKPRPGMWAVLISAVVFALVHTQTFQASFISSYGAGPIGYRILERILNVFLIGAFFALLRHWTGSILPGAVAHSLVQGGILALPFCVIIYGGIAFWAYKRGESVFPEIVPNKGAA